MLCFGEFVLKSGRISPYFFDSGMFNSGEKLARLASFYAIAVEDSSIAYDMLFGAAYKGIPLVAAVAVSLSNDFGRDVPYCFSGQVVGAKLASRVLIVDDVVSAGTSVNESVGLIRAAGAIPAGAAVSVDRQERGQDCRSAIRAIEADLGAQRRQSRVPGRPGRLPGNGPGPSRNPGSGSCLSPDLRCPSLRNTFAGRRILAPAQEIL